MSLFLLYFNTSDYKDLGGCVVYMLVCSFLGYTIKVMDYNSVSYLIAHDTERDIILDFF